ncbi:MAG: C45 family peptidase [Pseudotabrizicola sp.]|uniref:C45 family autoproteolytic acyltransferase/hydolase n=1 Tax=Pseudotabrizicola sp. TaxID=2939647 RepID=UPI002720E3FB|nr:C45 family peptidase [Pseudotabrizicola sp.]MDO8883356.1 C45 family peptidase [Pseudotabrizicola sp.]MDP2080931.1 C45 family peptidase [Pseudotabrizicola sp.]MDZ7572667.1 C45 family peptidase [Pseudotabrizicola sp.]
MIEVSANGTAYERGKAQAGAASADKVRQATIARVERASAEGLIDTAAETYLAAQRQFHERHDPEGMAELSGVAAAFGLSEPDLFAHLHLGTLRDIKGGAVLLDGCSAWVVPSGPEGALVVKNRDTSGIAVGVQCVLRHSGPDILTGQVLSLGSLGSLAVWSSGINAAGLAVADTQVAVNRHRVGWLRYFLLPRLLARARTVAEAVAMIRSLPHAGGGTLVLADREGATAAVELSAAGPVITQGGVQWRTNHYTTPQTRAETLGPDGDKIAGNSHLRFDFLGRILPDQDWTVPKAKALMSTHPGSSTAPLCQHADGVNDAETISSVVYSCSVGGMEISDGTPCLGQWQRIKPCR